MKTLLIVYHSPTGGTRQMAETAATAAATDKTGGTSPFGQTRKPTAIKEQALAHGLVYVNGGQRGL